MAYLKQPIDEAGRDNMRIALSVRPKKISPEPVCDFCGSANPVVVYAASRMSTGEIRNCWRWAACEVCETLVDSQQWREVELRVEYRLIAVYREFGRSIPEDLVHYAVKGALNEFHMYAIGV